MNFNLNFQLNKQEIDLLIDLQQAPDLVSNEDKIAISLGKMGLIEWKYTADLWLTTSPGKRIFEAFQRGDFS